MLTPRRSTDPGLLLEREPVLARIRDACTAAAAGTGRTLVVSGPPGIGKTRVLDAAIALGRQDDLMILRARGAESEQGFPFAGALQLLEAAAEQPGDPGESLLRGAARLARPVLDGAYLSGTGGPLPSAVHGLFWLTVNLAQRGPLALVVDDLHALDEPTLAYLLYLHRRIADLPIVLLAASRPVQALARPALSELVLDAATEELRLPPLSAAGVAGLVRAAFDPNAEDAFCQACARVSGGNPFYLNETLQALRADGAGADREAAGRLTDIEPQAVARSVLLRVARLEPAAQALARACAIVGPAAPVALAAGVAELPVSEALDAADALERALILEPGQPLTIAHPLIGSALEGDMPGGLRAELHLRAAELLAAEHAPAERIAPHLLHAPPAGNQTRVDILAEAAAHGIDAGIRATAIAYLNRALAEPPATRERRAELLSLLTQAEIGVDPGQASRHLAQARALGAEGHRAARLQLDLGRALYVTGAHGEAARALLEGAEMLSGDDPLARELMAWYVSASVFDAPSRPRALELAQRLAASPPADPTPGERAVLAQVAVQQLIVGAPLSEVRELAELAWGDGELLRAETADGYSWMHVTAVHLWGGDFAAADAIADAVMRDAQRRGSVMAFATASYIRASAALWQGRLRDALADIEATLDIHVRDGWSMFLGAARYIEAEILLELGDVQRAADAVAEAGDPRFDGSSEQALLLYARGRVRLAQDRAAEAAQDLTAARDIGQRMAITPPQLLPWWNEMAEVGIRRGDREQAASILADAEPVVRRAELPGQVARLLVTRARLEDQSAALATLREAVAVSEDSQARLEHARARLALGAALRRAGQRQPALAELRAALDLAHRLGAGPLERQAREELAVAGARPRRALARGVASLTASELRIARLAADGLTNRAIAEALFVTPKTVEYHLRNAFMKLDVTARTELAAALAEDPPA